MSEFNLNTIVKSISQKKTSRIQKKLIEERGQIVALSQAEVSQNEIAVFINRHISTVRKWIKRINMACDLKDRHRNGRPMIFSELSPESSPQAIFQLITH